MNDCCSSSQRNAMPAHKRHCPECGTIGLNVSTRTMAHHMKEAWKWRPSAEHHYFCANPECDIVYFGDDDSLVSRLMLRTRVGVKDRGIEALLCHCFGISRGDFERNPSVRVFVVEQTQAGRCSCETSKPSRRCCLKDFPKPKD